MSTGDPFLDALDARVAAPAQAAAPRSMRNNNSGNLRWDGKSQWQGMTGVDPDGFVKFDTPENGDRALSINMANQAKLHGINTVRAAITKYAPPSDGNNTDAYVAHVAQQLGVNPDDPIDLSDPRVNAAMTGAIKPVEAGGGIPGTSAPAAQGDAHDPYLQALNAATAGADATLPSDDGAGHGDSVRGGAGAVRGGGTDLRVPPSGEVSLSTSIGHGLNDAGVGVFRGITDVGGTVGAGIDYLGKKTGLYDTNLRDQADATQAELAKSQYDPNGWGSALGKFTGDLAATAPLAEVNLLRAGAEAKPMAQALARYGNMALQGGAAGALVSGGHDTGISAAAGSALGPAVGKAFDVATPYALAGLEKTGALKMAAAIRARMSAAAPEAAADAMPGWTAEDVAQGWRRGADGTIEFPSKTIRKGAEPSIDDPNAGGIGPDGNLRVNITPADAIPPAANAPDTTALAAAMGSRGARRGLMSNTDLPPDVAEHVQRLVAEGVPLDQALREADTAAIGAKPTIADVTRDFSQQQSINEGAKLPTPEGQALQAQQLSNNAAAHRAVQDMVAQYGGVPEQGEAMAHAAQTLANASDAERAGVRRLYDAADKDVGGVGYIDVSGLRDALNAPDLANPTIEGAKTLRSGVLGLLDAYSPKGEKITARQAEQLRKAIGMAYDPMGGSINQVVGGLKNGLDHIMDQEVVSAPYRAARAAHKTWADKYENPAGVSDLIERDAKGNFVGAARKLDRSMLGDMDDRPFVNIVKRLRANGNDDAIDKLKASFVQAAYEKATAGAPDALGNAPLNGKMFLAALDGMGKAKIDALFSKEELALIASRGRAAIALNERVPGTVNTSNTASAMYVNKLGDALAAQNAKPKRTLLGTGAKATAHVVLGPITHGGANVALEGLGHGANLLRGASRSRNLAQALRETADPASARAATKAEAARLVEAMRRRETARTISSWTPPVAGSAQQQRRR